MVSLLFHVGCYAGSDRLCVLKRNAPRHNYSVFSRLGHYRLATVKDYKKFNARSIARRKAFEEKQRILKEKEKELSIDVAPTSFADFVDDLPF